jgi:aminoglycoside phosphotransferase (APT) family kinase protein
MEICFQPAPGARAVAALHQQDLAGLPRSDKPALLGQLADIRADAGAAGLETESLSKVCDELVRRFDELESLPDVTLHGDLTPRNLLVSGDAACLIDLDDLRRGNPLQDIGSFNAVLFHSAIVNSTSMAVAGQSAAAFSQAYAVEVPWRIPERNISLFTAHALVAERIGSSLKRGREDLMQPLLQVASRLLD